MKEVKVGTIVKHLKELGIECMYLSGSYVSLYWRGEDWKDSVGAAVYHLQGSEERFIDMTRAKRVYNVQRYFKDKKERYMMTIMGRLSDALNEVGTAFKELKEDSCD